jgi:hypothetical protein
MNPAHSRITKEVRHHLAAALGVDSSALVARPASDLIDLVVSLQPHRFAIEYKASAEAAAVAMAIRHVTAFTTATRVKTVPLVVVPWMGEVGRRLCEEAGVGWLDLSGNADISAPGLRIHVEGRPNLFKRVGRPRSLFAPKSARLTRWLLMRPGEAFSQRQLSQLSGLDEGFTSRIVRGLEEQQLLVRDAAGAVSVADHAALLAALRESYDFSKHHRVRCHLATRSGEEGLRKLAGALKTEELRHAATGLAGAWLWSGFAGFRLTVMFVEDMPDPVARKRMGLVDVERGENVWLVQPNDEGVFHGGEERQGIPCAHPVQVYLDLKNHPERAAEAAEDLRSKYLTPPVHA